MSQDSHQRLIVTCDNCGTPYPATSDGDGEPSLIGVGSGGCPDCGTSSFSRISL